MKILVVLSAFFWSGMVFAISFIEAPLKFKAPFVTEKIGLGIGQLVFHTLNKIEWILALILIACLFILQPSLKTILFFILPILFLSIQTFFLYPILDYRVKEILLGNSVEYSRVHLLFIFSEIIKFLTLIISGITFMKS